MLPVPDMLNAMGSHNRTQGSTNRRRHILSVFVAVFAAIVLCLASLPAAFGDDATPTSEPSPTSGDEPTTGTVSEEITDPDNLLGDNVTEVKDAIELTEKDEGVHVRLLYLESFTEGVEPGDWASQVLEATSPKPNTVMLAVASDDGNLVVAVSKNSDEWLTRQETVDKLSDAAVAPIAQQPPNWAGSAIALMDELATVHHTSTSSGLSRAGIIALIGVLAGLVVITIVVMLVRRLWRPGNRRAHVRNRHAKGSQNAGTDESDDSAAEPAAQSAAEPAAEPAAQSATEQEAQPAPQPQDADGIQETSSKEGDA